MPTSANIRRKFYLISSQENSVDVAILNCDYTSVRPYLVSCIAIAAVGQI